MTDQRRPRPLKLTRRALRDIEDMLDSSRQRGDEQVAVRYIDDIQSALVRCSENPGLLKTDTALSEYLRFYVVNQHILVCDVDDTSIVVLTVCHSRMDLVSNLATLEPSLALEVRILREKMKLEP